MKRIVQALYHHQVDIRLSPILNLDCMPYNHPSKPICRRKIVDCIAVHQSLIQHNHSLVHCDTFGFETEFPRHNLQSSHPIQTNLTKLDMSLHYMHRFRQRNQDSLQKSCHHKLSTLFEYQHHMIWNTNSRISNRSMLTPVLRQILELN